MAPQKTVTARSQQRRTPAHDKSLEPDNNDAESNDDPMDKDAAEEELEKLVFGDDAGFREGLRAHTQQGPTFGGVERHGSEDEEHQESAGEDDLEAADDADLFFLDSGPTPLDRDALIPEPAVLDQDRTLGAHNPPAWEDSDDERVMVSLATNPRLRKLRISAEEDLISGKEYTKRLRRQFERLHPVPDWALPSAATQDSKRKRRRYSDAAHPSVDELSSADDMDMDDEELTAQPLAKILQSAGDLTRRPNSDSRRRGKLRPEVIDIQRTKDVPGSQPSAINSLAFHPSHPILLSSGPASTIYVHHIAPSAIPPNPLLTSLHIRSTPLTTTAFQPPAGSRIFFSGRRRYFHSWDLSSGTIQRVSRIYGQTDSQRSMEYFKLSPCGRYLALRGTSRKAAGTVNILDATTSQWICAAGIDAPSGVADFAWWADGNGLCIVGRGGGEVTEWDVRSRQVVARWRDVAAVTTTVVALGGSGGPQQLGGNRWIALGSSSGVVSVWDRRSWTLQPPPSPAPARVFDQLTTPTSVLEFSPDGQLLVMMSRWKRDALRLVHLPSCTVYKNWPTGATPLGRITAVAFAPDSSMLAVANEQGKIRLWEIRA